MFANLPNMFYGDISRKMHVSAVLNADEKHR